MSNVANKIRRKKFIWNGVNSNGTRVSGENFAESIGKLKSELHTQGIAVQRIKRQSAPMFSSLRRAKIGSTEITVFCRQLAIMLEAGIPVVETLDAVGRDHENPLMEVLIMKIKEDIVQGNSMSDAFKRQPKYFDILFSSLVGVGEQTGSLVLILNNLATYREKTDAMKSKVKKAMFYPISVITMSLVVALVLLIFVVPQFEQLFSSFGAELPAFTRAVLSVSEFTQHYWYVLIGGVVGAFYLFKRSRRLSKSFLYKTDNLLLNLPIIGRIFQYAIIARTTRTMGISYNAGIPLTELLETLPNIANNVVFARALIQIKESVTVGESLSKSMKPLKIFPNIVVQMIAVGESSGSLDKMLAKVADYYEGEVDTMVDGLSSLMEPVVMVILGLLIGSFVAAMYLPIFQLGSLV